ncbi:MAG: tRNA preQ1(34) S-adenosylmethionine ribosyltransferase-isomerase QueA [Vicinamibacterales bacterium]|jgi:S-adenosylmethionine:tRNA ribosyltransferase-isomerase|nr:tRNA preQ1(34) S-adenosylmethionine ribosyltransferase-isomerase QueA [Acidobacteriota bacterium]MDP6372334.1 tRNA preQ1(34) S-adenosylmethionine ribosyltransferase-isomerase QueA [Vicinamibacterales bacterium]MDP6608619.1 tRNA preQ1(34) S-adenosylmethionine ribosyltransferase-isomerase QueA [Vicinamibacterales bacterium]
MDVADFDFVLPPEQIAQRPRTTRTEARLLVLDRTGGVRAHTTVAALPEWLERGDLLVVNDTRVFPARLLGRRVPSGGAVECLLLERLEGERWDALVHPGQKLRVGERVRFEADGRAIDGEILERRHFGRRTVHLSCEDSEDGGDLDAAIDAIGHVPLPPYIRRPDADDDRERYQTVYARARGSVAAPTAGLHLTEPLLGAMAAKGVGRVDVTLHVGYGTFKPVRGERVEEHAVDPERYAILAGAAAALNAARNTGRRVVAVGTTTTRALESAGRQGAVAAGESVSDLFIRPGHRFAVVGGLLTNFHLPRSSLLMLVCAFAGRERVLAAYTEAVRLGYRFYSYGDAMLVL